LGFWCIVHVLAQLANYQSPAPAAPELLIFSDGTCLDELFEVVHGGEWRETETRSPTSP
jgi:hypothetical protein